LGINGVGGRMGQRILHLATEDKHFAVVAALEGASHPRLGDDVGELSGLGKLGLTLKAALPLETRVDVMIDFSTPEGTMAFLPVCVERRIPLLIATTGHSDEQRESIESAAHET